MEANNEANLSSTQELKKKNTGVKEIPPQEILSRKNKLTKQLTNTTQNLNPNLQRKIELIEKLIPRRNHHPLRGC